MVPVANQTVDSSSLAAPPSVRLTLARETHCESLRPARPVYHSTETATALLS
ncbi:hypothetical protein GMORB2_5356 [Geosmithia morbida]|uniref:Uncharacterized protein n=1 Tax=Geosmithia morbida TaxID=1094350 RepID=A0A9P4YZ38_9HYPO|nr:uncharacterized protein GMORB2_5356 [Geosmithia morbida]KAF4124690.1 hypothetical protein GMORB2_5356 [Geosmithia morbida]